MYVCVYDNGESDNGHMSAIIQERICVLMSRAGYIFLNQRNRDITTVGERRPSERRTIAGQQCLLLKKIKKRFMSIRDVDTMFLVLQATVYNVYTVVKKAIVLRFM
jgi:hypothetical protein